MGGLAHVAIRARDLEASARFYTEVLGLCVGDRPPFGFPGRWLYRGDEAIVHLLGADDPAAARYTGSGASNAGGSVDHIAFAASDWTARRARLEALGIAYLERITPETGERQVFVEDPSGVTVELSYPPSA